MLVQIIDELTLLILIKVTDGKVNHNFPFEYSQSFVDFLYWLLASIIDGISGC